MPLCSGCTGASMWCFVTLYCLGPMTLNSEPMALNPRWAVLYGRMVGAAQQGDVRELVRLWKEVSCTLFAKCMVDYHAWHSA